MYEKEKFKKSRPLGLSYRSLTVLPYCQVSGFLPDINSSIKKKLPIWVSVMLTTKD